MEELQLHRVFRAMYINQEVFVGNNIIYPTVLYPTCLVDSSLKSGSYLSLRELSDISDEEAMHIAKMQVHRNKDGSRTNWFEHYNNVMGENCVDYVRSSLRNSVHWDGFSIWVFDYLRSKGFLIPFMGLSIEEIKEKSWAVNNKSENK